MPEWLTITVRVAGIFILVLLSTRLLGKRPVTRLTLFDLTTVIVIGFIAGALSLNLVPNLANGLISLGIWILFPALIYALSLKFKTVRDLYQGKETVIVNHGRVLDDKLLEAGLTPEDFLGILRQKNVFNFADVEFAVLEPTGELSVLPKKEQQGVTPKILGIKVAEESVPQTVILDGNIMDEALTAIGLNRNWLLTELDKAGVAAENIFIAQVDSTGQLYLDLFDDSLSTPQPTTREMTLATLKKCLADCELFALGTRNPEAKTMYRETAAGLNDIIAELEPLLGR
ncbi:MAG: DUF421 domain-containing protein [Syntrophomonadaceae bacterium]|nr:DUF421 domain-containing protein [Syntrophomonadaceae bacterium]